MPNQVYPERENNQQPLSEQQMRELQARRRAQAIRQQAEQGAMQPRRPEPTGRKPVQAGGVPPSPNGGRLQENRQRVQQAQNGGAAPVKRTKENTAEKSSAKKHRTAEQRARRGCLVAFLVFLLVIAGVTGGGYLWVKGEVAGKGGKATEAVIINVPTGTRGKALGQILEENQLIGNKTIFQVYVKMEDLAADFQSGEFIIEPGTSYKEICQIVSERPNARATIDIRIKEGVSIMSVAAEFEKANLCTAAEFLAAADNWEAYSDIRFIQELQNDPLVQELGEEYKNQVFHRSEGCIFPDTYQFYSDLTADEIVRQLYEEMDNKFTEEMYQRMQELDMSIREVLTLASLIEAEASGFTTEQPIVSRVFWNRLSDNWQTTDGTMGSDVTIRYVRIWMQWNLPEYADKKYTEITYDEAKAAVGDTLFYSYVTDASYEGTRKGLPNGPICSVSATAIGAALYPSEEPGHMGYHYFVTDAYNTFYYGNTLADHNANVANAEQMDAQFAAEQAQKEAEEAGEEA